MTKITIDRSTVEQALEALERSRHWSPLYRGSMGVINAIDALRAALAEPTVEESLQVESAFAENATTQQQLEEAPPSDYRRGYWDGFEIGKREGRIEAENALAEPVQEPVAWMYTGIKQDGTEHGPHLVWRPEYMDSMSASKGAKATPLYTAPPQRPAEPVQDRALQWGAAPVRIELGSNPNGWRDAFLPLGKDHTLWLLAETEALPLVEGALRAALAEPVTVDVESALQAVAEKISDQCAVWHGIGARDVEEVLREAARHGLVHGALAEPVQEPDSPERRCGGPGCDMTCCQPVQEPYNPSCAPGYCYCAAQEPVTCRYPDCVDNGPEGKCVRWLVGECDGPKIGGQP